MDTLATYSDKSHFGVRSYTLYPDRVAVRHRDTIKGEAEGIILLKDLEPEYMTIAIRSSALTAGLWLTLVPWLIYWTLIELAHVDPFGTFAGFFLALGFVGIFVLL